ncbi:MAG: DUF983 domain-containing protein [Chitinophagaceae bacterium]
MTKPKPGFLWSILTMRCPRCRRGGMFKNNNSYKKLSLNHIFDMYEHCPVCRQKFDLEVGFWYGTGYVSYALTVLLSGITFLAWWAAIGVSTDDNRIFYWLIFNTVVIVVLQPWLMRLSRAVYIYFFIKYNESYESTSAVELHTNEE